MTKDSIKEALIAIVDNTTTAGSAETLTEMQLDAITDAVAEGLNTVNPTKEYPPVKL
nr:hypothetical protein [uncultured Flavobacterium sp.]